VSWSIDVVAQKASFTPGDGAGISGGAKGPNWLRRSCPLRQEAGSLL